MEWLNAYIYCDLVLLREWLCERFPAEAEGEYVVPASIAFRGPYLLPREQTGTVTEEDGNELPQYAIIPDRTDCVCLVSVKGEWVALLDEVAGMVYAIHRNATVEEIKTLYPDHCLGCAVPYISGGVHEQ